MFRIERSDASEADLNLIPSIDEQRNIRPSMLYHVLPTMVSNRIPTLPSLRRSLSGRRHVKSHSLTEIPVPGTPPPHYTSRPGSGSATPNLNCGDTESDFSDDASERPSSSFGAAPPLFAAYETKTGISWKYASSGMNQVLHRTDTANLKTCRHKPYDPSLSGIKRSYSRDRRDVHKPCSPTLHTRLNISATRSPRRAHPRRDVEPPGSRAAEHS